MNILTISSLYPNNTDPSHGIFVERRLLELVKPGDISATVVAPVPWFPFKNRMFGDYASKAGVLRQETRHGIEVFHPRFVVIPKVGMNYTPRAMANAVLRDIQGGHLRHDSWALIDAHYFYPDGVAAAIVARRLGIPYIVTARGSDINLITQFSKPKSMILDAAAGAFANIAVSQALVQRMVALGVDKNNIHLLRNGVDLEFFCPGDNQRGKQPRVDDERIFLTVGSLKPEKGHDIAIQFVSELKEATLNVVGRGPDLARLKMLVERLGVTDRVRFMGTLGAHELRSCYREADALILMSEREGMPNVVLESLACGTPVLASCVGGIPEIIESPLIGEMTTERTSKALLHAWRRLESSGTDSAAVRNHAEHFSWGPTITKLRDLIDECARHHGKL